MMLKLDVAAELAGVNRYRHFTLSPCHARLSFGDVCSNWHESVDRATRMAFDSNRSRITPLTSLVTQ